MFRNNTFFSNGGSYDTVNNTPSAGSSVIYVVEDPSNGGCIQQAGHLPDQGHNFYVNNIIVSNCGARCENGVNDTPLPTNGGPLIRYASTAAAAWFASDTYRNNLLDNASVPGAILNIRSTVSVFGTTYDCSGFASNALVASNLCNTDPQFVSANPLWWTAPGLFNFRPKATSPAIGAASPGDAPPFDVLGSQRPTMPTIGAFEPIR